MRYIIGLTLNEIVNKRILHLGVVLTAIFLIVYGIGIYNLANDNNMIGEQYRFIVGNQLICLGWYMSTFLIGTLAILMGAGSLSREIESGTILGLASRPLRRRTILTGKFLAYNLVSALYSIILLLSISLVAAYYFRLNLEPLSLGIAIVLFLLIPMALLSLTHLVSACYSTLAAGITGFMLFSVAIIAGFIEQFATMMGNNATLLNSCIACSLLLPTDAVYRMAISRVGGLAGGGMFADIGPFGAASTPSVWMLVYTLIYIIIILLLAMRYFENKDL